MSNETERKPNTNTTTAVALRAESVQAMVDATGFTTPQIHTIKRALFKGEGDEADLWLFLTTCKRWNADPFRKEIHPVFRWDSRAGKKVMVIQTGIDQLRKLGKKNPGFRGIAGPYWKAKGEAWTDLWEDDGYPFAAKVGIWLKDCPEPIWGVAKWSEFAQKDKDGRYTGMWGSMPSNQLAKCAEAQAWRKVMADADDLRVSEETPSEDEAGQIHAAETHQREIAITQHQRSDVKRFPTTAGWPASPLPSEPQIEDAGEEVAEFTEPAQPVTEEELAAGVVFPEAIAKALEAIRATCFAVAELPWNNQKAKRDVAAKGAGDQLRLHDYTPDQIDALYDLLHFAGTGERLEPGAMCSARCFVAVQAMNTPQLQFLREAADWWLAQMKKAA
jgi:hypothetical protein